MRPISMFIAMTAMVLLSANSVRGNTSPGPLMLGGRAGASELSSLSAMKGDDSSSQRTPVVRNSAVSRLFVSASPDDKGCEKGGNSLSSDGKPCPPPPPPPRSKRCPCDSKGNPIDKDCGKGNSSSNP
jgi:hypothetical protein